MLSILHMFTALFIQAVNWEIWAMLVKPAWVQLVHERVKIKMVSRKETSSCLACVPGTTIPVRDKRE